MLDFLDPYLAFLGPQLVTVIALIVMDLLFGVGKALRTGEFDWGKLADFYRTNVIPKLFGWAGLAIGSYFVAEEYLPGEYSNLATGVQILGFGTVVISLANSAWNNLRAIIFTEEGPDQPQG
jgi:hypothetical protein